MARPNLAAAISVALLLILSACGKKEDKQAAQKAHEEAVAQETAKGMAQGAAKGADAGASVAANAGDVFAVRQGTPFLDRFRALDDAKRWNVSDGWSNGAWMASEFRRSQLAVTPHGLDIKLAPSAEGSSKPYAGGEFSAREAVKYGYFEIRMRVAKGSGLVNGVFTYAAPTKKQRTQEIDIEILGRATRRVEFTIHQGNKVESIVMDLPFDAAEGFHTYAFDWKPSSVTYYVDGKKMHTMRGAVVPVPNRAQNLIVDLWNTQLLLPWAGPINASEAPWTLSMSCIAYAHTYNGKPLCTSPYPNDVQTAETEPGASAQ